LMIKHAQASRGRIIAIGTTVARALKHTAAMFDGVVPFGERLATQRLGASTRLRIVDAILSGTHEPDTSHYELLRAFVDDETLSRVDHELNTRDYRTHEFGDSVFLERATTRRAPRFSHLPHDSMCHAQALHQLPRKSVLRRIVPA